MSRKIFIAASVIMVVLFALSAAARYAASGEFKALEAHEEGADRERWIRLTDICTVTSRAGSYLCRFYPAFIFLVWLTDRRYFRWSVEIAVFSVIFSALPWAFLPYLTDGHAGGRLLAFYCRMAFTETALVCVCIGLTISLYKRVKTLFFYRSP